MMFAILIEDIFQGLCDNLTEENMDESDENKGTIMDVDSFEDHDSLLYSSYDDTGETHYQNNSPQYSSHYESPMVVVDVDDDSLSDISNIRIIDVKKELNKTTSIKIPEQINMTDNSEDDSDSDIEIIEPLMHLKKNIVSGQNTSFVKFNPPVKYNQFTVASTATVNRPKTTITHLQPESSGNIEIDLGKNFLNPKQQLKITSSKESKSEVKSVSHNGMNYMTSKEIPTRNPLLKSNSSLSPSLKAQSNVIIPTEQKKQFVFVSSKVSIKDEHKEESKFIARIQPLSGGKYKMVPDQGRVPINLESVFRRNPNFTKQKLATNPTPNEHQVYNMLHIGTSRQLANIKETRNVQHKILDVLPVESRTVELNNESRNKKCIPHTVTSKDLIERNSKIFIQNSGVKINTNCHQKISNSPKFIQLSSNSESLEESDSLPLSHTKYGKISRDDHKTIQLSSNSLTKSKTKLNSYKTLKNGGDDSNTFDEIIKVNNSKTHRSQSSNIIRAFEENSNKHKVSFSDKIIDLDAQSDSSDEDDTSNQFISCKYEYCDILLLKPELIDDLYCSLACKNSDIKQTVTEEEHCISEKITVGHKNHLTKLKNRVNKRKQLFKTSFPEDKIKENDVGNEQLTHFFYKPLKEDNQPPLKSLLPINSPGAIDDDYFDLKPLIEDEDVFKYMTGLQFRSAPKRLFDRPFPTEKNLFIVGQKLEGIDPKHEALFCVMTVSEVCGYRIKLHFDGYEDDYDFWVNADCPDLFHAGFCEMNFRILQPPKNYCPRNPFKWVNYLGDCQALPAPIRNFVSTKNLDGCKNQHKFHVGGKLEALDKLTRTLPKQLICVATVADILGNRVRIHLDGWINDFDYWVDITSTNIHPVGWCENNGRTLSSPRGYIDKKRKKPFNWNEYLADTNSEPVPEDAFVPRPLLDFSDNMIIEVVDLVVPRLLRIAKVVDVRRDELKIVYDGFVYDYAYWVEDDSPDIHPVGWSSKTNHPIELPPVNTLWSCNIHGCKGYGNSSNGLKVDHVEKRDCPYEIDSWKTAVAGLANKLDRLKTHNVLITTTLTSSKIKSNKHQDDENKEKTKINTEHMNLAKIQEKINEKSSKIKSNKHQDDKNKEKTKINTEHMNLTKIQEKINKKRLNFLLDANDIEPECDNVIRNTLFNTTISNNNDDKLRKSIGLGLVGYNLSSPTMETQSSYWTRYNAQLGIPLFNTTDARKWSIQEVASYVQKVVECHNSKSNTNKEISIPDRFIDQAIDGDTFLMLTQDELMKSLKIPLGPAIKIINAIIMLRQRITQNECM